MSRTACRQCSQPITFVQGLNGRWRPVEARYTLLELDSDELIAVQDEGTWRQHKGAALRVYRAHACPESPADCAGRPRTITVDATTGEVIEPEDDEDDEDELDDVPPAPEPPTLVGRSRPTSNGTGTLLAHGRVYLTDQYSVRRYAPHHLAVACPMCLAPPTAACLNAYNRAAANAHLQRGWVTAFDDAWDQPWPPVKRSQRGVKPLENWLAQYGDVLTTPATPRGEQ